MEIPDWRRKLRPPSPIRRTSCSCSSIIASHADNESFFPVDILARFCVVALKINRENARNKLRVRFGTRIWTRFFADSSIFMNPPEGMSMMSNVLVNLSKLVSIAIKISMSSKPTGPPSTVAEVSKKWQVSPQLLVAPTLTLRSALAVSLSFASILAI